MRQASSGCAAPTHGFRLRRLRLLRARKSKTRCRRSVSLPSDAGRVTMAPKRESGKLVAENRKARFNYDIEEKLEAGIALKGSEVKSLRAGRANIAESYASDERGELYLINAHIGEYAGAARDSHAPSRPRKLLLRAREIAR